MMHDSSPSHVPQPDKEKLAAFSVPVLLFVKHSRRAIASVLQPRSALPVLLFVTV